jgi:HEPN domain-containing protein
MAACDEARRLLAKAGEDEYVLDRLLGDAAAPEAVVGFHAQQAAEKLLKAALFLAGVAPPRTHNLAQLADLAASSGLNLPTECEALRWLTPYAVLYRYEGVGWRECMDARPGKGAANVGLHTTSITCKRVFYRYDTRDFTDGHRNRDKAQKSRSPG